MESVGRLSDHRPCPESLEAIIIKATAKEASERYESARAMVEALEAAVTAGMPAASLSEVRDWLAAQFTGLHAERQSFEQSFIAAIEADTARDGGTSPEAERLPEREAAGNLPVADVEQMTSRWLLYGALGFLVLMATAAVFVTNSYSTSGQVTEGFYEGESEDVASVFVLSRPAQAAVSLDGEFIGHTTQLGMTIRLKPGSRHRISLTRVGYEPFEETIVASTGGTQSLIAKLEAVVPQVKSHELRPLPRLPAAVLPVPDKLEPTTEAVAVLEQTQTQPEPPVDVLAPIPAEPLPIKPAREAEAAPERQSLGDGLRPVHWGMTVDDVRTLEVGREPVKVSERMVSYSGTIYGEAVWLNYIFLDEALRGVIYLFNRSDSTHATFERLERDLAESLGTPTARTGSLSLGRVLTWDRTEGEVKLVLSRKKKSGQSIKIMDLSMSWESFNVELGTGSR